jgi:signal transduction histidine kinase
LGVLAEAFNDMVVRLGEQKQRADEAHARLLEANLHLENKIAERTSAIEAASQRLASEIAEKEDFLRAISHDLNAPLRNIDGMVSMILRKHGTELPEEVAHRLERVKKNVEHETGLISELLELSRIKTRREQPEPVNLEEMMWELRGIFENDLRERDIELVIETRLPTLTAERARIRQVFQNLVDNAIKYMGEGPDRRITIGARPGRSETEFWVRDSGQGIPPEDVEKIFYVFRRGRNQQAVAGKGVGLASVKSILENYNGRIWVESELGRGSSFRFTINGRFVAAETAPAGEESQRAPAGDTARSKGIKAA